MSNDEIKFLVVHDIPFQQEVYFCKDFKEVDNVVQDTVYTENELEQVRIFRVSEEISVKKEKSFEERFPDTYLTALRNIVISTLENNDYVSNFDEELIRSKIEGISNNKRLLKIVSKAAKSNKYEDFIEFLEDEVRRNEKLTKIEIVDEKELEKMGISKDQQILDELFLGTDLYDKEEKLRLLCQLSYAAYKELTPRKLKEIEIEMDDVLKVNINGLTVSEHQIVGRFVGKNDELTRRERNLLSQYRGHVHKVNVRIARKMLENGEKKEYVMDMLDITEQEYDLIEREIKRQSDVQTARLMLEMIEEDERETGDKNE